MSEDDESVLLEDANQKEETEQIQSKDPLDNITDAGELRAEAKKFRGIANRKASQQESKPEDKKEDKPDQKVDLKPDALPTNSPEFLTREEGILLAQGYDEQALDELKAIAKGKGISLLAAKTDPLFIAYEKQKAEEKRQAEAKLGASNSSGKKTAKDFPKTREEHMQMWEESQGH